MVFYTFHCFNLLSIFITLFSLFVNLCYSMNITSSLNGSLAEAGFLPGVATFFGPPESAATGGACGYMGDVINAPYNAMIAAVTPGIFKSGDGCGSCYQVLCTSNPACSGSPVTVTIVDECDCDSRNVHFDLSGKAMGAMAKPGQANALRNAGLFPIQYRRVPCRYGRPIRFHVDAGSTPFFFSVVPEFEDGGGDIGAFAILPKGAKRWIPMQRSFGANWKVNFPNGAKGPFSLRLEQLGTKRFVVALKVLPADWKPNEYYESSVNF